VIATLYAGAATLAAPALRALLRRRVKQNREIAARLPERWGEDATPRPPGRLLWLHGASVGEVLSIFPLLHALAAEAPDVSVLVTTGTVTSAALFDRRLPEFSLSAGALHRFVPLDVPAWVARFLDHWRPDAAGFVEQEVWPNLLAACAARNVPTLLLNARLSARSFARWQRVGGFARETFGRFDGVLAQSDRDASRIAALGGRAVSAPGNLKFAADKLPAEPKQLQALARVIAGRPVWLAASTHPGEDAPVLQAHAALAERHDPLLTIIVPRHPSRGAEVARIMAGWPVARRSDGQAPPDGSGIWIGDTLGELGLFYRLAPIAFIGGSMVPHGGQNPLEAARLGCAVAVGPRTENFAEAVAVLCAAGALTVVADPAALAGWVDSLLKSPDGRRRMGEAGIAAAGRYADLPRQIAAVLLASLPAARI
jgi:3-deoxy-D-manno-octulosonic-acid transferase